MAAVEVPIRLLPALDETSVILAVEPQQIAFVVRRQRT